MKNTNQMFKILCCIFALVLPITTLASCDFLQRSNDEVSVDGTQGLKYEVGIGDTYMVSVGEATDEEEIVISAQYDDMPVVLIKDGAFSESDVLKKVTVPEGIKQIGSMAFSNCPNLENVILPQSIEFIGSYAFSKCGKIKSINLLAALDMFFSS